MIHKRILIWNVRNEFNWKILYTSRAKVLRYYYCCYIWKIYNYLQLHSSRQKLWICLCLLLYFISYRIAFEFENHNSVFIKMQSAYISNRGINMIKPGNYSYHTPIQIFSVKCTFCCLSKLSRKLLEAHKKLNFLSQFVFNCLHKLYKILQS